MEILNAKVQWYHGFMNPPKLMVLIEDMPKLEDQRWVKRKGIYYCEQGDLVNYFYYVRPDEGYGGRKFPITMLDGSSCVLEGPWSSRASVMNAHSMSEYYNSCLSEPNKAFPCSEVIILTDSKSFERGWTGYSGNLRLPALLEAAKLAGVHLLVNWSGSSYAPDTSGEQTDVITGMMGHHTCASWGYWVELPPEVEYNFCPSLLPDRIKKFS